ncbi:MAG: BatD family protein [Gallionella sp.]
MKFIPDAIILFVCVISLSAHAATTATLDRNQISPGETVQLRLQHEGNTDAQPDISPLKQDFELLGSSSGSRIQNINGHRSSQTSITIVLSPKHEGKIVIPPLQWDGESSAAIELTVGGNGGTPGTPPADFFFETRLDKKQIYVQSVVVLTVKLYTDEPFYQASLSLAADSDLLVKPWGKDLRTSESRDGRNYQVIQRQYLLFPQRSGKFQLKGPILDAQVQDTRRNHAFGNDLFLNNIFQGMPLSGMTSASRPLHLMAHAIEFNVLPRPINAKSNWLPAQQVTLKETWTSGEIHVGDPFTRHLQLSALGLTGEQLPDPDTIISIPKGIKTYPEKATVTNSPQGNTVLGLRVQDIALIAEHPGTYTLPEVKLAWWDTLHDVSQEVTLPAHTLNILPNANAVHAQTKKPIAPSAKLALPLKQPIKISHEKPWVWISLALGLLWVGTILAWLYTRKPKFSTGTGREEKPDDIQNDQPSTNPLNQRMAKGPPINTPKSFKYFLKACHADDPHAARRHLLAWALTIWPNESTLGLNELSRRLDDVALTPALRQLDSACYKRETWHGAALAQCLASPPKLASTQEKKKRLPELYS